MGLEGVSAITAFQPFDDAEAACKAKLLADWASVGELLLSREHNPHITVSAIVLNEKQDKVLMVHHNLYQTFAWPGGHADGGKDFLSETIREVQEETGVEKLLPISGGILSLDFLSVPVQEKHGVSIPAHHHYSLGFALLASEQEYLRCQPEENSAVLWVPIAELNAKSREPHMIFIYEKILSRVAQLQKQKTTALSDALPKQLVPWFQSHARDLPWRKDRDPYHVWLSEIMLQQTRVEAVKEYYQRFLQTFPTVASLANGEETVLLKLWEGLGYYNRARNLQKAARVILETWNGNFPETEPALRSLPGVGAYTAGAIGSICFELPTPAVDGNVLRVISRLTESYTQIENTKWKAWLTDALRQIYPKGHCGAFTQALMELGATICLPNGAPKCEQCPVASLCLANQNGTQLLLPVKKPKAARKQQKKTVFLLQYHNQFAVERRQEKGVLHDLWQFPNVEGILSDQEIAPVLAGWGIPTFSLLRSVEKNHIFTHIVWEMIGYEVQCDTMPSRFLWVSAEELEQTIALPTAFRQFLAD